MKSKYLSILASLALACSVSSCVDLDLAPTDQKSTATMWQTPQDAEQGVSILYNWIPRAISQNDEDVYTDNATHGIKWAVGARAHGVWQATDFSWEREYSFIRSANLVFANIDQITGLTDDDRNNILGQAHLFRGWIYLDLIKMYGDVPYYTEPLELSEQEDIVRTDWKEVYTKSMADLDEAIRLLPETTTNGRVNKAVGHAIKARYALYFANPDCQHSVDNGYSVAAAEAKAIIDSGRYGLFDGGYSGTAKDYTGRYAEMFWGFNIDESNEGILTTYNNSALGTGLDFIGFECFPTLGWGGTNPTQDFVDCFEDVEGAPISKSKIYDPLQPKLNRDPRLTANVLFTGDERYGEVINTKPLPSAGVRALYGYAKACGDATLTGYQACKWLNPDVYPGSEGWNHDQAQTPKTK